MPAAAAAAAAAAEGKGGGGDGEAETSAKFGEHSPFGLNAVRGPSSDARRLTNGVSSSDESSGATVRALARGAGASRCSLRMMFTSKAITAPIPIAATRRRSSRGSAGVAATPMAIGDQKLSNPPRAVLGADAESSPEL